MITRTDLNERVREWGLREDVVEKDYALGWALWGIGSHPQLAKSWAFKGGTCLKKCYVETYRFSEDLDFTVLPDGPVEANQVIPILKEVFEQVYEESGIDFREREPRVRMRLDGRSAEGRIYYRGPRNAPQSASIRLDLTIAEQVVRPTVLRPIAHPYPDTLPSSGTVRCYGFEGAIRREDAGDGRAVPAQGPLRHHNAIQKERLTPPGQVLFGPFTWRSAHLRE